MSWRDSILLIAALTCACGDHLTDVSAELLYGGAALDPNAIFADHVAADAPLAWYRLGTIDEGGTFVHDATGHGHATSYGSGCRPGAFGAFANDPDTAATCSALGNGTIAVPDSVAPWTGNFTLELYVALSSPVLDAAALFVRGTTTGDGFWLAIAADQALHLRSGATDIAAGTTALQVGKWAYVALTRKAGTTRLYVDGVLELETTAPLPGGASAHFGDDTVYLEAQLDEAVIYDRALDAATIALHAKAGTVAKTAATCSLTPSAPLDVTQDGTIVSSLSFDVSDTPAITVNGAANVVIRNVDIHYSGTSAIAVSNAGSITIEDVRLVAAGATDTETGITIDNSANATVSRVIASNPAGALAVRGSAMLVARFIAVTGARASAANPSVIGIDQLSDGADLSDISITETNSGVTSLIDVDAQAVMVARAALDGAAIGVHVDQNDCVLLDIDVAHADPACVAVDAGTGFTMTRVRCRDIACDGHVLTANAGVTGAVYDSRYTDVCGEPLASSAALSPLQLSATDFAARPALSATFCFDD